MAHASLVKLAYNKVEKIKRVKKDMCNSPNTRKQAYVGYSKNVTYLPRVLEERQSHLAPHVVTVLGRLSKGDSQSEVRRFLF